MAAYLFKIENSRAVPNVETLLIEPFKTIWEKDTTIGKTTAILELTFIEFMSSSMKSNPYKGYEPEKRIEVLKRDFMPPGWEPDDLISQGLERIKEFQTEASPNYTLYKDALVAKEKLQRFLRTFDMTEKTNSGSLVLKPGDVTKSLMDIEKVAVSLDTLEKKIDQELFEEVKTRANKEISIFAKPEHLTRNR